MNMMNSNFLKTIFVSLFLLTPLTSVVYAAEFDNLSTLGLDLSISSQADAGFGEPTKILITPISMESKKISPEKWIKGVYYYTVDKLGFQDIPYHYLVTESGEILKANNAGDEKKVKIDDLGENNVVIGYLNYSGNQYISSEAEASLKTLLLDISNRNGIKPQDIFVSGTKFVKNKSNNTITIKSFKLADSWNGAVSNMIVDIAPNYSPTAKSYSLEVLEVTVPSEAVNPGDEVNISVKLKNNGTAGFYQGSSSEILLTKENGSSSNYFINNVWVSQTQTGVMTENQPLTANTEKTFDFKVKAPLANGDYSETFILKTLNGAVIKADKKIELKIKLKQSDKQIIEIKPTAAGSVNVRKSPNDGTVLRRVTPGERFFLIDVNQDTLWAEIDLGDGTTGYLPAWQFSYL